MGKPCSTHGGDELLLKVLNRKSPKGNGKFMQGVWTEVQ